MEKAIQHVSLKCEGFHDNGNGTITLAFPARTLSADEHRLIEEMIPARMDGFYKLLQEQTLLNMIATESDMMEPKVERTVKEKAKY